MSEDKEKNLNLIKQKLICAYGDQLLSAIVYGSTLGDDYCKYSDYDVLLIFENINFEDLKHLRKIKENLKKAGIIVDFNLHIYSELPKNRQEAFWHNNRGTYIQKELALYGRVLFGEKYFQDLVLDREEMFLEAVRVISSLNYQIRKMLVNKPLNIENRVVAMKWCIYSVMYFLAANDCYPRGRAEALEIFDKKYHPPIHSRIFLDLKLKSPDKITDEDLELAFDFLAYMEESICQLYQKRTENKND